MSVADCLSSHVSCEGSRARERVAVYGSGWIFATDRACISMGSLYASTYTLPNIIRPVWVTCCNTKCEILKYSFQSRPSISAFLGRQGPSLAAHVNWFNTGLLWKVTALYFRFGERKAQLLTRFNPLNMGKHLRTPRICRNGTEIVWIGKPRILMLHSQKFPTPGQVLATQQ